MEKAYRVRSTGVLLTYFGVQGSGKTEWAQSLFQNPLVVKVGKLEHFPESMRAFDKEKHDGLVLDDLRDSQFLVDHQDKLQGKYNSLVEFASAPGGDLAYWTDLFAAQAFLPRAAALAEHAPQMPVASEMRHPKGFSFQQERRIALLRDATQGDGSQMEWSEIAKKVRNLLGHRPRPRRVANARRRATARRGPLKYDYKKCGKKPDKVTKEVERFLVKKLKALRCRAACTSTVLQLLLAPEMNVKVTVRYARKVFEKEGYRWLPKRQQRLYSKEQKDARLALAKKTLRVTSAELNAAMAYAMGGVVLAMPPKDETERTNFCRRGEEFMWRKNTEAFSPKLSGDDEYGNQVPLARAVPMWAGCAAGGLSIVAIHPFKKLCGEDWAMIVSRGDLVRAVK
ncbi:unnamed protein product, partial [Prorocentrum cordatum]